MLTPKVIETRRLSAHGAAAPAPGSPPPAALPRPALPGRRAA